MILIVKHVSHEGAGTIEEFVVKKRFDVRTLELYNGDAFPVELSGIDAVISMGGPMSVYEEDKHPFLKNEDVFLKEIIKHEIPFLGICLGSQLLAKAAGAKVVKAPKEEIGWFKVDLTKEGKKDSLFEGLDGPLDVFQWHGDTFDIPARGKHLAEAKDCRNQALKVGRRAYGFQFHIEVTKEIIADWVGRHFKGAKGTISPADQKMIDDYARLKTDFDKHASTIYENFLKIM